MAAIMELLENTARSLCEQHGVSPDELGVLVGTDDHGPIYDRNWTAFVPVAEIMVDTAH